MKKEILYEEENLSDWVGENYLCEREEKWKIVKLQ